MKGKYLFHSCIKMWVYILHKSIIECIISTFYFTENGMVKLDDFVSAVSKEQTLPEYDGR